jgi:hypothetical protein
MILVLLQLKKMSNKIKKDDNENEEPVAEINGDDGKLRLQIVGTIDL